MPAPRVAPLLIPLVVGGLIPAGLGSWLDGPDGLLADGPRAVVAAILIPLGIWMVADAVASVYLRQRTPLGDRPPDHLVRHGWYRVVRNPMAGGMTVLLCGQAVAYTALSVAVWALVVLLVSWGAVVRVEEPSLLAVFGEEYAEYASRTPAWFPSLKGRSSGRIITPDTEKN